MQERDVAVIWSIRFAECIKEIREILWRFWKGVFQTGRHRKQSLESFGSIEDLNSSSAQRPLAAFEISEPSP
jgi:hypothetical protein